MPSLIGLLTPAEARAEMERRRRYRADPVAYIRERLKADLWSTQEEICRLLMTPPHKVLCKACHKVGKSWLAAAIISWFYDNFNPGLAITTAPSDEAVKDQLWRELRVLRLRAGRGGFRGPAAPELWSNVDHWAKGFTAKSGEAFQGRHQEYMLFVIDEGVGVEAWVYDVIRSMFKPGGKHFWLIIGNPTDTSSPMYTEELAIDRDGNPSCHLVQMSALDHPNLAAELAGQPPPFPAAVSLAQFEGWLADWADAIPDEEATALDVQYRGRWYRPGPQFEARALGRWPSEGTYGIWSDALWQAALHAVQLPHVDVLPEIGCDVARYGDDYTEMHVRCGAVSLHHERHNGWSTDRTAAGLRNLADCFAAWHNARLDPAAQPVEPQEIRVKIDDGGVGGGVTDQSFGYNFIPVLSQATPCDPERYESTRSELWFVTAERARRGGLDLSRLHRADLARLRQQAMGPIWEMDAQGRRKVEKKKDTKKRLGTGSPDGMDAMNLAYYAGSFFEPPTVIV